MFFPLVLFTAILAIVAAGLGNAGQTVSREGASIAAQAVRRAAVSCYAIEGAYPESYEYLCNNYGLAINNQRYTVDYQVFASNIMPDITVIPVGGQ